MGEQSAPAETTQAANAGVLIKLFVFTLSLGMVPVVSYFASLKYLWSGNSTYAAITSVAAANIVLVLYITFSIIEDRQDGKTTAQTQPETKKKQ
ncbi:hypothetical protein AX14_002847 [Amanita brunnescens Koide BX004]|nr:hypothetical protein AX14_002847 [Amanita brunnescens Koide BX004]